MTKVIEVHETRVHIVAKNTPYYEELGEKWEQQIRGFLQAYSHEVGLKMDYMREITVFVRENAVIGIRTNDWGVYFGLIERCVEFGKETW